MRISTQILTRSKIFLLTTGLWACANIWTWARHLVLEPACCDLEQTIGFPVPFQISGGIAGESSFHLLGLLLDIALGVTLALILTWIVRLLRGSTRAA